MHLWLLAVIIALVALPAFPNSLSEIASEIDGHRMRASSTDIRPDGNRDNASIPAGETLTVAELEGPGIIQHIWFTVSSGDFRYPSSAILRIYWDDHPEPSVQTQLGDFFAAGNGMRVTVNSEPVQVSSEGRSYNCFWQMPFKRKARIEVENQSDKKMGALYYYVDWLKLDKPKKDSMYFHAQFRQERPHDPAHDYTILETTGQGHYVGTVLSSQNCYHAWFGEGDDRVYIDGESTPSITGTGTEDYFNDAWGFREFNHPYAGCTIFEGRSIDSRVTAYRWHVRDPIPFEKSLRFTIENKGWVSYESGRNFSGFFDRRDNYSSVAFWYQKKPATGVPAMPPLEKRIDPEIFFNARALEKLAKVESEAQGRASFNRRMLSRRFFHLQASKSDAAVTFPIEITKKGRYSISIWQVNTPDGGIYEVYLDDKIIEPYLNFYNTARLIDEGGRMDLLRIANERKLGLHYLDTGVHKLRFKCIGRNSQSHMEDSQKPGYGLGINCLSFRKIAFENMDQYLKKQQ
jgi:D-arabinan exo alpha-(1,3)/(1,5)-arabinofuranosidase (non-reducing end)